MSAVTSPGSLELSVADAAALSPAAVSERLAVGPDGLSSEEVARRRAAIGPNVIAVHRVRPWEVLQRQLRSALLLLLVVTAAVSFVVGDRTDAVIIGVILVASVGLGFVNEYRAELAAQALHTQIRHDVVVRRDGRSQTVDVKDLVPGDLRAPGARRRSSPPMCGSFAADGLECDESVLTGESLPAEKSVDAVGSAAPISPTWRRARSWARSCVPGTVKASSSPPAGGRSSAASPSGSVNARKRPSSRSGSGTSRSCSCRSRVC